MICRLLAPSMLCLLVLLAALTSPAQITPSQDAYTNTADPTTNYGAKTLLDVDAASQITYIQFNLASIPSGANISQATLKLYVNSVSTAGSFNVDYVNGTWAENTIDASNAPALGNTIAPNVSITAADKNQYILIDITPAVQTWLNGSQANDGIALVATSTFNATFDSKENTTTSHPAELDIAYAGGDGTITGVTTASGSGLTGGGTSGALNLSLTNACAANQVLRWSGTVWICASVGTGTITGVTAGTDLTGGGTSGNVTLNLNTATTDARYAQLAAPNTFTGSQTVNGNVSATGLVTGAGFQIGSNLFDFGSYGNGNAFLGFAGSPQSSGGSNTAMGLQALALVYGDNNTASGAYALYSDTIGSANTASGYAALYSNMSGSWNTANGYEALWANTGSGNTASGYQSLFNNTSGTENTSLGMFALASNTIGSNNTALGYASDVGAGNLSYATAVGSGAAVSSSNSLVLGRPGTNVGIGTSAPGNPLTVVASSYIPVAIQSNNTFGTWMTLGNTSTGAATWNILSAGSGNSEGAGNLAFTNFNSNSTVYIHANLRVDGTVSKGGGSFQIDHPLDPANKYLYHSFVESPDMKNIYDGVATLDENGEAVIQMPDWFGALNRDFRYQLTCIGGFAPVYVADELANNQFKIGGGRAGLKVSWQVTGIRQDAWADAHRIPVEELKNDSEQGLYLHPELYGAPPEKAIGARVPATATPIGPGITALSQKD
jgi:hypothetical protein